MRITARWIPTSSPSLILPAHYNHAVQAMIYASLDPKLASQIHNEGYTVDHRQFRLFTFSRLFGSFQRHGDELHFVGPVTIHVTSPIQEMITNLAQRWLQRGTIVLGQTLLTLAEMGSEAPPFLDHGIVVQTLSPITVYSTVQTPTGKKTYYYAPFETAFADQCSMNLRRKYGLVHGSEAPLDWKLSIIPLGVRSLNQVIIKYKDTVIKAWTGRYRLEGPAELLSLALDAGLGAKNSQGFGMLKLQEDRRA